MWLRSVGGRDMISKSHAGKQGAQRVNGLLSSSILHHENLGPLAVCINYLHDHISLNWSSKIDMKPLSGESGVLPSMQGLHELVRIICSVSLSMISLTISDCPLYGPCRCLATKIPFRDKFFILAIPIWPSLRVSRTLYLSLVGTTALLPHIWTTWWMAISLPRWALEHGKVLDLFWSAFSALIPWLVGPQPELCGTFPPHPACRRVPAVGVGEIDRHNWHAAKRVDHGLMHAA